MRKLATREFVRFMSLLTRIGWPVQPVDPELVQAQAAVLTRQVPLLYVLLMLNTGLLAVSYLGVAPLGLTVGVPSLLALACSVRLVVWWKNRNATLSTAQAHRLVSSMQPLAGLLAIVFAAWGLSLYDFGDPYQQSHIAFYMGITTIGCMFCLSQVRWAPLTVGLCVLVPFTWRFGLSGNTDFAATALNMALVVLALIVILLRKYHDFAALVASRREMAAKQAETQRLSDENDKLANSDSVTDLPNRRRFDRELSAALLRAKEKGSAVAVARLDMDGFKSVNDIFGHVTGDKLLREIGRRIQACTTADTFLARIGGDNFALIIEGLVDEEHLRQCGRTLCEAMRRSFILPGANIRVSASAGFAVSKSDDTADTLHDRADYATSVAKREARGSFVIFGDREAHEIHSVRTMEHALYTADFDHEIYVLLQPQFDLGLGRTTGFEVLARWRSPLLGDVSPAVFIPMAERTGTISKITQTVVRQALAAVSTLPRPIRLSVNLSAHDIGSRTAIDAIVSLLENHGKPCRLDCEITETAVMRDL